MKNLKTTICVLLMSASFFACTSNTDDTACATTSITYTKDMKSLLTSCAAAGCHNSGSLNGPMSTLSEIRFFVTLGKVVGSLKHSAGFSPMPQNGTKWDACMVSKLEAWISAGMPE